MKTRVLIVSLALALSLGACESDDSSNTAGSGGGGGGGGQADTAGGGGGGDAGGGGGGATGPEDLAKDQAALHAFLMNDEYGQWAVQSAVQDSTIHGKVLVHVNDELKASLEAANASHPAGSMTVKELYAADGTTLEGWAVMIKTQADSAGGDGWYWYESKNLTDATDVIVSANGSSSCTGCHSAGGSDFFKTPFPLQ